MSFGLAACFRFDQVPEPELVAQMPLQPNDVASETVGRFVREYTPVIQQQLTISSRHDTMLFSVCSAELTAQVEGWMNCWQGSSFAANLCSDPDTLILQVKGTRPASKSSAARL